MIDLQLKSKRKDRNTQIIEFDEDALTALTVGEAVAMLVENLQDYSPKKKKGPRQAPEKSLST
jgi:hypothetical protein